MAAHKYDLCTVPTERTGPTRRYPWYKERLQWKYLYNQQKQLNTLTSCKWRFIPSGSDDFRSGAPQINTFVFPKKKPSVMPPIIDGSTTKKKLKFKPLTPETAKKMCSKVGPRHQIQIDRLNNLQDSLLEHPLSLYPHLQEGIPLDIYDDVIDYLDPDLKNIPSEMHTLINEADIPEEDTSNIEEDDTELIDEQNEMKSSIYCWPLKKSAEEIEEERLKLARQRAVSPTQEAQVNHVTHDLIQWTRNLDENNTSSANEYIDEETIKRLFASDYEAKPVLTAPIHVVELSSVPHELRADSRGCTASSLSSYRTMSALERHTILQEHLHRKPPKTVHTRYGAWYLKPTLWKLCISDKPLEDPKIVRKKKEMQLKMVNESLDAVLAETHGAKAFKEFVSSKYQGSIPEFFRTINSGKQKARKQTIQYS